MSPWPEDGLSFDNLEATGAEVPCLSPYSPNPSPIRQTFTRLEHLPSSEKPSSSDDRDALGNAIAYLASTNLAPAQMTRQHSRYALTTLRHVVRADHVGPAGLSLGSSIAGVGSCRRSRASISPARPLWSCPRSARQVW